MNSLKRQGTRFLIVGAINTLIDLGIYSVLRFFHVPVFLANFVSTLAGLTFSYFGNSRYTFKNEVAEKDRPRTLILFFVFTGIGIWILHPLVIMILEPLVSQLFSGLWEPLLVIIPKLAAIAVGLVWNFICYRNIVFRNTDSQND